MQTLSTASRFIAVLSLIKTSRCTVILYIFIKGLFLYNEHGRVRHLVGINFVKSFNKKNKQTIKASYPFFKISGYVSVENLPQKYIYRPKPVIDAHLQYLIYNAPGYSWNYFGCWHLCYQVQLKIR